MPYAPGIQSDFSPLFAGIQNFGKNIQAYAEKRKQESQEATTLRKLMSIYAPDQKDSLPSMGLKELRANAAQYAVRQQKAQMDMQQQEAAARMKNMQADNSRADQFLKMQLEQFASTKDRQSKADTEANTLRKATTGFAQDFAAGPPMVLRPDKLEKFAGPSGKIDYALGRNPDAIRDPGFQHFVQFVSRMRESDPKMASEFVEDPTNGTRFMTFGRQVLPSGVNPEKVNTKSEPLHDADGNPVPGVHVLRDPKGRLQVVKTSQPQVELDSTTGGTKIRGTPEQVADWNAKNAKAAPSAIAEEPGIASRILSKLGIGNSPAPAARPPMQFKPGEVRKQNGRLWQFNGTGWEDVGAAQ